MKVTTEKEELTKVHISTLKRKESKNQPEGRMNEKSTTIL